MNEQKHRHTHGDSVAPARNTPVEVVDIQFRTGAKVYYFDPAGIAIKTGDHVIIETARGPEYGICTAGNHKVPFREIVPPLRKVVRLASEADEKTLDANRTKEKRAYDICMQKVQEHKLDMQLVSAEYAFDGSKILFFFTSDDRVDFRDLVKNLASIFHTRIELRQIGVRDKAKMVGGLGICGRPFCCTQFLDDFQPVSIKMAKTQNLSLNPTKISGTCGRLMCCLKYEQDAYEDLLRHSPRVESFVDTPDGRGTIVEVNLLRQSVRVRMEDQPETVNTYPKGEIYVLRSGKAKKTDPPIPADLAPISGQGKRRRLVETVAEETPIQLDPIRFRYRPDDIVEEPQETPEETHHEERRRKKRPQEPRQEAPAPEVSAEAPADSAKSARRRKGSHSKKPQSEIQPEPPKAVKESKPKVEGSKPSVPKAAKEPKAKPDIKPKADHKPKSDAKPKADVKPKADTKPKAEPKANRPAEASGAPKQIKESQRRRSNHHHKRSNPSKKPKDGSAVK